MKKSDSALNFQNFTIRPAGNTSSSNFSDLLDLDDIFQDEFFPPELDFSNFNNFDEQQQRNGYSMTGMSNNTGGMSSSDATDPGTSMGQMFRAPESSSYNYYSSLAAAPSSSSAAAGGGIVNSDNQQKKKKVIMIPPTMPRHLETIALPKSAAKSQAVKKKDPRLKQEVEDETNQSSSAKKQKLDNLKDEYDDDEDDGPESAENMKIERRERNREHAKRSRIRKRVLLETLQDQLTVLRDQNIKLRRMVADKIPTHAANILAQCTTEESDLLMNLNSDDDSTADIVEGKSAFKPSRLTSNIASEIVQSHRSSSASTGASSNSASQQPKQHAKILMEPDFRLIQSLITSQQNFVLSDPSLPDNPIVYVSDGFCRLTGYKRQDCVGRNCRFLQGPGTDQAAVEVIRQGVYEGRDISVCLLNYRADGTPFWNQFFLGALKDSDGQVVNYVGVQCEVNTIPVEEIKDRVKKLPMPDDI